MALAAQIPTSFGHELRACLRCRLVKTYDQFRESGCENCPFFKMDEDHERCTTPNFTGLISVMDPTRSWAARWLRIGRFRPGCYTLAVSEPLPEDLQETHPRSVLESRTRAIHEELGVRVSLRAWLRLIYYVNENLCEEEHVPYVPPKRV